MPAPTARGGGRSGSAVEPAGPLEGRTVMVTRARDQAGDLVQALVARGAVTLVAPAIRLARSPARLLDPAVRELLGGGFDWVVFTSRAGAEAVLARIVAAGGGEVRAKVAAVGDGTARTLRGGGIEPDLVPRTFTTRALGRGMPGGSGRVLLARADIAPSGLEEDLRRKGWTPVRVDAYRTVLSTALPAEARRALLGGRVDAVTFTSASTVEGYLRMTATLPVEAIRRPKVVCIGPVTARSARDAGARVNAVARPHTIEGLVSSLERVFRRRTRRRSQAAKGSA